MPVRRCGGGVGAELVPVVVVDAVSGVDVADPEPAAAAAAKPDKEDVSEAAIARRATEAMRLRLIT